MARPREVSSAIGDLRRRPAVAADLPAVGRPRRPARARHAPRLDRGGALGRACRRVGRLFPLPALMAREPDRHAPQQPGPIGGDMAAVLLGVARRLQLPALEARHSQVGILGLFAFVNGVVSIGLMAMAALLTGAPFIFPSLGPTAFLLFFTPTMPAASPRNTLGGHLIGVLAGYLALVVFGLTERGPALASGVDWANVGAAALVARPDQRRHGLVQGSPSAGRRHDAHRLARHSPRTVAARGPDARRRAAGGAGVRDQPPGGHRLSVVGAAAA